MPVFKLPFFGHLDIGKLDEYYDTTADFNGREIQIDLNFNSPTIAVERMETIKQFIDNIRIHDLTNRKYMEDDYNDPDADTVKTYLEHHLEELGEDELEELLEPGSKQATYQLQLLKKLHIVRVGIYAEGENQFATFDYSLGEDLTNYLVVIDTDENGNLVYITMES